LVPSCGVRNHHELPREDRSATPARRGHGPPHPSVSRSPGTAAAAAASVQGRGRSRMAGVVRTAKTDRSRLGHSVRRRHVATSQRSRLTSNAPRMGWQSYAAEGDAGNSRGGSGCYGVLSSGDRMLRVRVGRQGNGSLGVPSKDARRRSASRSRKNFTTSARARPTGTW
jgi:hypothetical protein